ncbi:MAG: serine hydrolase domain-containing protein [Bacteroidota bacterium]
MKFKLINTILLLSIAAFLFNCNSNRNKKRIAKTIQHQNTLLTKHHDSIQTPKIDQWFKKLYTTSRFTGNILVAQNGVIVYENSYGYANYTQKDTLTLEHKFQIGSVSKQFTSMAIMILKEKGLLDYQDNIKKFIQEFPYENITIYQLLTHRSGLSNYNYFSDEYTDKETIIYNKDVVNMIVDSVPLPYYQPNFRFNYCNTNYVLLAEIVEIASGIPFEKFVKKEIFQKAGMLNSHIFIKGKQERIYKAATGYHFKWLVAEHSYQDGVTGDKGVYTTVEDLFRWDKALYENRIVNELTLNEAFLPAQPEKKGNLNYGFGWRLRECIDGSRLIFHGGWWRGFNALFIRDLKNKVTIIILSNIRTRSISNSFRELLGIFDPERLQEQIDLEEKLAALKKEKPDSVMESEANTMN